MGAHLSMRLELPPVIRPHSTILTLPYPLQCSHHPPLHSTHSILQLINRKKNESDHQRQRRSKSNPTPGCISEIQKSKENANACNMQLNMLKLLTNVPLSIPQTPSPNVTLSQQSIHLQHPSISTQTKNSI